MNPLPEPDSISQLYFLLNSIHISLAGDMGLIAILVAFIFFTAVVAGSEIAFFSLSAKDINFMKSKNTGNYRTVINLLENPKQLLATLLIVNSFLSIAIIITTSLLLEDILGQFPIFESPIGKTIQRAVEVVIELFLLLLFGEVLPKVYATQNNMRMSLFCAPIVKFFNSLAKPFSNVLVRSSALIERKLAAKTNDISDRDVEAAMELTVKHSATKEEVNILKGILKFGDITAKQIMRPRLDVFGIDHEASFSDVKKEILEAGYSRVPVYSETLDEIKGVLHTKDLLPYTDTETLEWHSLLRPALFVHESKIIKDLLEEFQQKRSHLAIVVDEWGGTSGILTMEDIMEEIIGEIKDEFDEEDIFIKKENENTFVVEGKTLINDLCRSVAVSYDEFDDARGESDSVAGLILELYGKFPTKGDSISFKNYEFTVVEIEKNRIQKVKLTIHQKQDDEEESNA